MSTQLDHQAETQYREHHLRLLRDFVRQAQQQPPFVLEDCPPEDLEFLAQLEALPRAHDEEDFLHQGQQVLGRVIAAYGQLMPLLHRDLLWYFGGDCLHFMPDEEIANYQILDERRHEAQAEGREFSYAHERAKLFGLH
ncbi:PA2817 family protein [Marinimicrobium sp. ARAG 43.8]|uniref:PA2817 family protein n=1 Tax=Marinimicrobium sp. ARAG 43.8 TaxID=3418719 RepID=UPI003CF2BC36